MAKWYSEYPEYSEMSKVDYDVRCAIEGILSEHTTEMENYGYFGSNPGVPQDNYDNVAEDIMTKLNLWEKKDAN